ncbi:MAG: ABATE domain-containing protein [Anaerolineales bacterium]
MVHKDWDLDSGNLVLDFANTAEFHASEQPDEMLETYSDLVSWSLNAGLVSKSAARDLQDKANREPKEASKALRQALAVRETIYKIFSAVTLVEKADDSDFSRFNRYLTEAYAKSQISPSDDGFSWTVQNSETSLDRMLWPILREAANLITSQDIKRVGECADNRGCGYLFLDTSRNHSRRWCSMESCGNRAKAQRHYQKISKK